MRHSGCGWTFRRLYVGTTLPEDGPTTQHPNVALQKRLSQVTYVFMRIAVAAVWMAREHHIHRPLNLRSSRPRIPQLPQGGSPFITYQFKEGVTSFFHVYLVWQIT